MKYIVQTYFNYGPGMYWGYQPGDRLVKGPAVTVEADSDTAALDVVWEAGNIGTQWSGGDRRFRSLSVGDVLVIGETAWAVASMGFTIIDGDALTQSLAPSAETRERVPADMLEPTDYSFEYNKETML